MAQTPGRLQLSIPGKIGCGSYVAQYDKRQKTISGLARQAPQGEAIGPATNDMALSYYL
jgi:hypothetical protein